MKGILTLFVGLYALGEIIFYLIRCPSIDCNRSIFGFEVSGMVFLLLWTILAIVDLYGFFKSRKKKLNS